LWEGCSQNSDLNELALLARCTPCAVEPSSTMLNFIEPSTVIFDSPDFRTASDDCWPKTLWSFRLPLRQRQLSQRDSFQHLSLQSMDNNFLNKG
jgi:hypothetical protein